MPAAANTRAQTVAPNLAAAQASPSQVPSRTAHLAREHRDTYAVVDSDG